VGEYRSVSYLPNERMHLYSMGYETCSEQARWGPGSRNYCILHFVTHGKGWFNGQPVHAGQGFYIHAGQQQEYHAAREDGWQYFWMILSEPLAQEFVFPRIRLNEHGIFEAGYANRLQAERMRIFSDKTPLKNMEALSIFFSVMSLHEEERHEGGSLPLMHLNSAKTLIENNFSRRLRVQDVAREIAVDDRYLYNLFIRYEGVPPKEYIDRCTVNNACALLKHSDMNVTEIALRLGFEDVCVFSKFFRKRTGLAPTAYRAQ